MHLDSISNNTIRQFYQPQFDREMEILKKIESSIARAMAILKNNSSSDNEISKGCIKVLNELKTMKQNTIKRIQSLRLSNC